jgi:hypothetical protein
MMPDIGDLPENLNYFLKANGKIVSVTYAKMGDNETFSKNEIQYLTGLNQGSGLVARAWQAPR